MIIYSRAANGSENYSFPEKEAPPGTTWVHFTLKTEHWTDNVNFVHAHERTHRKCYKNTPKRPGPGDLDGDRVPDDWEKKVPGMIWDPKTAPPGTQGGKDSFKHRYFSKNPRYPLRDNEFYAYLGGAYKFGSITKNPPSAYEGEKPVESAKENDWSLNGYNWGRR